MKGCVFAGTFDPITIGHEQIIKQALSKYGKVLVVVGKNPSKTELLSQQDRLALIKATFNGNPNVQVVAYSSVQDNYAEFLKTNGYTVYVRGIRNQADLDLEDKMKQINATLYPFITTEYLYADSNAMQISSSQIRSLIAQGKDWIEYVPKTAQKLAQSIVKNLGKNA